LEEKGRNRFYPEAGWRWGKMAQIMYTHVSKCKNDQIKFLKNTMGYNSAIKEERNYVICRKMDETGNHHVN
jgi:hypothetical protein